VINRENREGIFVILTKIPFLEGKERLSQITSAEYCKNLLILLKKYYKLIMLLKLIMIGDQLWHL